MWQFVSSCHISPSPKSRSPPEVPKWHPRADEEDETNTAETGWLDIRLSGCGSHELPYMTYKLWDDTGRPASVVSTPHTGRHAWQRELKPGRYRVSAVCQAYWGRHDNTYLDQVLAATGKPVQVRSGLTAEVDIRALSSEEIYRAGIAYLAAQRAANR